MERILLFIGVYFFLGFVNAQDYDSLIKISKNLRDEGKHQLAIDNYNYLLTKVPENSQKAAYLYNVLGIVYKNTGDKPNALKYLYGAIALNKRLENEVDLLKNYVNLSNYYKNEEQYGKSNHYLYLAKGLVKDPTSIQHGVILTSLGNNYSAKFKEDALNADSATYYYLQGLEIFRKNNAKYFLHNLYNSFGNLYSKQGLFESAEDYYLKSIELASSEGDQKSLVSTYRNLGNLYMDLGYFSKALEVYNKSLALSNVEKDPNYKIRIYFNLVKAKMALGQMDEASVLFQKFSQISDSVYNAKNVFQVKEMETKYETRLKEQAIEDQKLTIANKNFQKNVFLSLSILLVILIVVAIWFFNQKQKYLRQLKNEEIANVKKEQELKELNAMMHGQEEERNRIANDLHDRLGARLSSIKLLFQNSNSINGDGKQLVSYIDKAIKETREISHNLSTDMLTRFGIQTALKDTIRSLQESEQIEADLVIYGMQERWPVDVERNIYYVLLELINNTIKHAKASSLIIQIHQSDNDVNVFYEDNGKGFDTAIITSSGLGLRSLSARVNAIKGDIVINSKPGHGINVVITLDLNVVDQSSKKATPSEIQ